MATSTTNLGLIKPAGSDKIRIAQINQNSDLIDAAVGPVGSTNLQAQANALKNGMAIVSNNNTHAAITAGQYVYVYGHGTLSEGLYIATANIGANGSLSGSNVSPVSGGGLNALNSKIDTNVADLTSGKLNRYAYAIPISKGVKIGFAANMPVIISAQRSNGGGRLILFGGGYGADWLRNDFVELIGGEAFTWCLTSNGTGIDVMNSAGNAANVQVISPGTITFTEITALSGTADTSHAVALKSKKIIESQTITTSTSLAYTGLTVTIPSGKEFVIHAKAGYSNNEPQEVAISTSSTTLSRFNTIARTDNASSVSFSGFADPNTIGTMYVYLWTRYSGVGSNTVTLICYYR